MTLEKVRDAPVDGADFIPEHAWIDEWATPEANILPEVPEIELDAGLESLAGALITQLSDGFDDFIEKRRIIFLQIGGTC